MVVCTTLKQKSRPAIIAGGPYFPCFSCRRDRFRTYDPYRVKTRFSSMGGFRKNHRLMFSDT